MSETQQQVQHLVKLCVGVDSAEHLSTLQTARRVKAQAKGVRDNPFHITRMTPRRGALVLAGGSLFWVIKGAIIVRQQIIALEPITGEDGISRCKMVLDHQLVPTEIQPRRPFQGWRYLSATDAPLDVLRGASDAALPAQMEALLRKLGAW